MGRVFLGVVVVPSKIVTLPDKIKELFLPYKLGLRSFAGSNQSILGWRHGKCPRNFHVGVSVRKNRASWRWPIRSAAAVGEYGRTRFRFITHAPSGREGSPEGWRLSGIYDGDPPSHILSVLDMREGINRRFRAIFLRPFPLALVDFPIEGIGNQARGRGSYPRSELEPSCVSATLGSIGGFLGRAEYKQCCEGVSSDKEQRQSGDKKLKIFACFVFVLGVGLNFYGMWNLQLGPDNWRGVVAVIVGLLIFMYGFVLFLKIVFDVN
jgi:hypothetical protein